MSHRARVRHAEVRDVDGIEALLLLFSRQHIVLPRHKDDIFEHLQEFLVLEYDGRMVGTAALHVYASHIAEIRSLVVHPDMQGRQLGSCLVQACEIQAAKLGVCTVFALTYVDRFFVRMGYRVVPKESLPHKIWTVCIHCEKFSACDEIAVIRELPEEVHALPLMFESVCL